MLKLTKRHGSPNWTARGTYLGVTVERSLGTGDKRQAAALLAKLQIEIFEAHVRGPAVQVPTFAEAALMHMKKTGARRFMAPLLRYFGDTPIDRIDQRAIDAAAEALYPNGAPATRNRAVYSQVSVILNGAGRKISVKGLKPPPGIVRWISPEEASRLVAACSPHLKPLVLFLLYTGARAGEALWLDWRCVDLGRAHVSFPKTKNGDPRGVALHPVLLAALANLPHRTGCVFRRPDGKPYERSGDPDESAGDRIATAFKGACRRAGLTNFRVHDCRHTWATWHFAAHHDLLRLKKLGGWRTLSMVARYAHANSEDDRSSIDALPTIGGILGIPDSHKREIL